ESDDEYQDEVEDEDGDEAWEPNVQQTPRTQALLKIINSEDVAQIMKLKVCSPFPFFFFLALVHVDQCLVLFHFLRASARNERKPSHNTSENAGRPPRRTRTRTMTFRQSRT